MLFILASFLLSSSTPTIPLDEPDTIELVETAPIETTLDHADIRNADVVWLELIRGAQHTLDFAEFYASDHAPSPLTPVIEAVEAAADGGVQVRFVGEEKFTKTYPEILERLGKHKNIEMRRLDYSKVAGGVLHARYFLVDGAKSWIGTSNWEKDYFYKSRNVGFIVEGKAFAGRLDRFFADGWNSSDAAVVDPSAKYEAPRTGD